MCKHKNKSFIQYNINIKIPIDHSNQYKVQLLNVNQYLIHQNYYKNNNLFFKYFHVKKMQASTLYFILFNCSFYLFYSFASFYFILCFTSDTYYRHFINLNTYMYNINSIINYTMQSQPVYYVGIRAQDKSVWERRTPLSPAHVKYIINNNPDVKFIIQSSRKRIFSDAQYKQAGAQIVYKLQQLSPCHLILGIKQIPPEKLIANKTFMYFSHTIKAQEHNMPALDTILAKNIRLIDYEKISDNQNNRLIAFGKYAGIAGAIDFIKGLGEYIMQMGISTPLLNANCSYKYFNLEEAYLHLKRIGEELSKKQIPVELRPMIFAITGRGRTAKGCLEVLNNFPIINVSPQELQKLVKDKQNPKHAKHIYLLNINSQDVMVPRDPEQQFDKKDYYVNPSKYKCAFKTKYLPYISALFHCIFWDSNCPKYISNKNLKELAEANNLRLLGICDVSCDLDGSIQCLQEYTQPEKPFFYYNSLTGSSTFQNNYEPFKFPYLAVDFLPCQLAFDASMHFGNILKDWVADIARSDMNKPLNEQGLTPQVRKSVIALNGKLTPDYEYINELREKNKLKMNTMMKKKEVNKIEVGATESILHTNVSIIPKEKIKGQKLSFDEDV